jgi:hypothetical protein
MRRVRAKALPNFNFRLGHSYSPVNFMSMGEMIVALMPFGEFDVAASHGIIAVKASE